MSPPDVRTPAGRPANAEDQSTSAAIVTDAERKRFQTLRAQFALAGFEFFVSGEGGRAIYFVARWSFTRRMASLDDAARFLRMVGGRP